MVFKVTKEHWEYQLEGKLIFDGKKILINVTLEEQNQEANQKLSVTEDN